MTATAPVDQPCSTIVRRLLATRSTAVAPEPAAANASAVPASKALRPLRRLLAPVVGSGLLLGTYLAVRPYGDAGGAATVGAAQAFASNRWVIAHLCGALGLASVGRLALRLNDAAPSPLGRVARWSGLLGAVLVLPYYGAETFALHVIGRHALAGEPEALAMVDQIRNQPVALATFGIGLLLLAASGITMAVLWQRVAASWRWAAWPLGVLVALVLPQFYLPPTLRIVFGVATAAAAGVLATAVVRSDR